MHRRFSSLVKSPSTRPPVPDSEGVDSGDTESKVSTIVKDDELPVPSLKVKRLDYYYSRWSKGWKYRNMSSKVTVERVPILRSGDNDPWKDFSFVVVRTIPRQENQDPTFKIVIKSEYILKACKDVIKTWPGISWNSDPLELEPETFLTFLPSFADYRDALVSKKHKSERDNHVLSSVNLLLTCLSADYKSTITTINRLKAHGEITFEHLYAILVPRSILIARCAITGLPRLFQLSSFTMTAVDGIPVYQLVCESVDLVDRPMTQTVGVGRVQTIILLKFFRGTVKIDTLDAFPLQYHPDQANLRETIIQRGKKWVGLIGIHHKQYSGIAALKCGDKLLKHNVKGRIMIDRATFRRLNANYAVPTPVPPKTDNENTISDGRRDPHHMPPPPSLPSPQFYFDHNGAPIPVSNQFANAASLVRSQNVERDGKELSDDDLLLTSTVVYGFSLSDKLWLEFSVGGVAEIDWDEDAFANLVLPSDRKDLLKSLVEAHHQELGFDDFIKGKGHGLVINLFGPPGVGKTFSAEATSEHVKRPLYVIGGGDLGTKASELDLALERVFDVATTWKAIVLIDEADVFLEQRSLHDLERNAMVAVFLRHVEYYRGILFLTTNRVQAFDEAFLSRIHVALHFRELSDASKAQVWAAFISKVGASSDVTPQQIEALARRSVNGRQIKNAVRTAHSLAVGKGVKLGYQHLMSTIDAMDEFTQEFEEMKH